MSEARFCGHCGAPRKDQAAVCDCGQPFPDSLETAPVNDVHTETTGEQAPSSVPTADPASETVSTADLSSAPPEGETPADEETTSNVESIEPAEPLTSDLTSDLAKEGTEEVLVPTMQANLPVQPLAGTEIVATQNALPGEIPVEMQDNSEPAFSPVSRSKKGWIYAAASAVGVVVLAAGAWLLFGDSASGTKEPLVYIKDHEIMLKSAKAKESAALTKNFLDEDAKEDAGGLFDVADGDTGGETLQSYYHLLGVYLNQWVKFTSDGSKVFYLGKVEDHTASLYYGDPKKVLKAGEASTDQGERIASNVSTDGYTTFTLSPSSNGVLYLKNYDDESGGSLYFYNMKEEVLIDKDVETGYVFSDDGKSIMYKKVADDSTYDLYVKPVESGKDKIKIDSGIDRVFDYSGDLKKIYYTKSDSAADDLNANTLYLKEDGKDKQKVISGYYSIESSDEDGQFFFTRATEGSGTLMDYVTDDMAEQDASIKEPDYSDYETEQTYTDYWGYSYTDYVTDYDAYYEAYDAYQDKLDRDYLRSELKETEMTQNRYSLFIYESGKESKLTDDFSRSLYADASSKTMVYAKASKEDGDKMKLSEITSIYDVEDRYDDQTAELPGSFMVLNGSAEQKMEGSEDKAYYFTRSEDGSKLYYLEGDGPGEEGTLVESEIKDGKLTGRKVLDENVDQFTLSGDSVYYYRDKDKDENQGDLVVYKGGKKETVASEVQISATTLFPDEDVLFYMTDYNEKRLTGTLYMKKGNEKAVKIADDVNYYNYNKGTDLFYVSDLQLENGEGDLWEYRTKDDKKLIDSDVQGMLPIQDDGILF